MDKIQKREKEPISNEKIFQIMLIVTYLVSGVFMLKNVLGSEWTGATVIGICMGVFTLMLAILKLTHAKAELAQFMVVICLVFLVFIISMYSGDYYSDDFCLYVAIIALTGLYMRPRYTIIQTILIDVLLMVQYYFHPEKAEEFSQFLLCMGTFTLAAIMFFLAISRGRAFINISRARAEEAELLLQSMSVISEELERNFDNSWKRMEHIQMANSQLEHNTKDLKQGSKGIAQGSQEVANTCIEVQERMQITESQIDALNQEVHTFEKALAANRENMEEMNHQMELVKKAVGEANQVFGLLGQQMQEITAVTEQMDSISFSTNMLALNASIEAARAGQAGAGFAVVASKVQELAVDSNKCSGQVTSVVDIMQSQIRSTMAQMGESKEAIDASLKALEELQGGFQGLTIQFTSLYHNIEEQNGNVNQVDSIFKQLKEKIGEMNTYSQENQFSVESIAEAIEVYSDNMKQVIDDTRQVHEISSSMLNLSKEKGKDSAPTMS